MKEYCPHCEDLTEFGYWGVDIEFNDDLQCTFVELYRCHNCHELITIFNYPHQPPNLIEQES